MGLSRTFEGNFSDYVNAKAAWVETQRLAYERQQKEITRAEGLIQRLSGGANTGRATSAEKQLEKMQEEGQIVEKPFEAKEMKFRFPELERSGKTVNAKHLKICREFLDNSEFEHLHSIFGIWRFGVVTMFLGGWNAFLHTFHCP
ncbi:unnamed protein product [Calypogeia fissa]